MNSFAECVALLRAAAEPTRLRILHLLQASEFNVTDLTQLLGQSQPRVSRHIKLLADAGLVERFQEGSWVFVRTAGNARVRQFIGSALAMIGKDDPQILRDIQRANQIREKRAQLAQAYFDKNAAQWDRIRSLHIPEEEVEAAILEALKPGPYELILDLGTGTGRILQLVAPLARRATGVDTNREMLKCARVRLDRPQFSNCSVRLGDIYDLPFPDNSADAVIIHQVLHFLDNPQSALGEAARVLKPAGRLLIVDFAPHNLEFLRDEHAHIRLGFSAKEVTGWCEEHGVEPGSYRELGSKNPAGQPLTVAVWVGFKEGSACSQWRAA
ncbi:MAG TPA: metalloregulator ArsR/SmtB family transcription factor [Hyphomicrobiales bacterium]|nr:metalloregulator ArsR/SmtB family transcription factor [Hyphomicrobiales bacterium]